MLALAVWPVAVWPVAAGVCVGRGAAGALVPPPVRRAAPAPGFTPPAGRRAWFAFAISW